MHLSLRQRTIARPAACTGVGVHSGRPVHLTVHPAPINHGIKFLRSDLPGCPEIPAHFHNVVDTSLATVIGHDGCIVSTIEHLMAALAGLSIDNALVEIDTYEVPIMDGSAGPFSWMLREAGIREQSGPRCFFVVKESIALSDGDRSVAVHPAPSFGITCAIDFNHPLVRRQEYSLDLDEDAFHREIAPARTFGFLHEVEYLKRLGLARGGSLDNVVVLDGRRIVNHDGLRFADEFVRHKILDCIGDFSLLGMPVLGHLVAEKSGHAFNHAFLERFFEQKGSWDTLTLHDTYGFADSEDPPQAMAM